MQPPLLQVRDLRVHVPGLPRPVLVLDGCDLDVAPGEVVGLVGESGSGKTMLGKSALGLLPPGATVQASSFRLDGVDLLNCSAEDWRQIRGRRVAMVFQDPMTALHPFRRVSAQLAEMLPNVARADRDEAVVRALREVQLPAPERVAQAYPHELSGGMRQRVMIAMMLLGTPELLIADEPTTALDVTVQAGILALLRRLVGQRQMALLLVSHDLAVVAHVADRVAVMYAGQIVETGPAARLLQDPAHHYTEALVGSHPAAQQRAGPLRVIEGHVPAAGTIAGCPFGPRCPAATHACQAPPPVREAIHGGHSRCHHPPAKGAVA